MARYAQCRFVGKYLEFQAEPPIFTVDQCWLLIVDKETILTCFPTNWRANDGSPDPLDVRMKIMSLMVNEHEQARWESAVTLACFIVEHCAAIMLQPLIVVKARHKFLN